MIMGGGTGGHVFPGLAVAGELRSRGWRVVWLGARGGMEATLVPRHGYEMAWVNFAGLRGKGPVALALLPARLLLAFWQAARAIFAHRPDVVLGMGGYQSFPGGMMAALFDRPLVLHEQNSVAGLANRVLARVADRILCAFPGALKGAAVTGNPVRPDIASLPAPAERYGARTGAQAARHRREPGREGAERHGSPGACADAAGAPAGGDPPVRRGTSMRSRSVTANSA